MDLEPGRRAVILYVIDRMWSVPGVELRPGMRTYAHYWIDRPYNVYHWLEGGRTVGYYVNAGVCERIDRDAIVWTDYAIDVLATPDGEVRVLDEEELAAVAPPLRERIEKIRDTILPLIPSITSEIEAATRRLLG